MKKLIIAVVILSTAIVQHTFAQTSNQQLNNVITAYIGVKNSLTKDNGDSVRAAAKVLYNAIDKMQMDKLSGNEHTIWMQYADKLSYDASHMKGTNDIDHQREHFTSLSKNMYKMLVALKSNTVDLYYQYCAMANDGKGAYWVSEKSVIVNPYLGKKMPTCGSTKDTIKAIK